LPWLSANTTSTLAPPRPLRPAFFVTGRLPSAALPPLMISTAVSIAALPCTPALAALPLKGKIAPILTVLSWAEAAPASATDMAAAESSPTIWFNFILKISPADTGSFEPGHARLLYSLRSQHRMADWHRQVAATKPARLATSRNNRYAQRRQIKRRACRSINPCPACIRLAPVEKVSAQAQGRSGRTCRGRMRAPSPLPKRPLQRASGDSPSQILRPKLRLLPCLPRPGPNE